MLHGDLSPPLEPTFQSFWCFGDFEAAWKHSEMLRDSIGDLRTFGVYLPHFDEI